MSFFQIFNCPASLNSRVESHYEVYLNITVLQSLTIAMTLHDMEGK